MPDLALRMPLSINPAKNATPSRISHRKAARPEPATRHEGKGLQVHSRRIATLKDVVDWASLPNSNCFQDEAARGRYRKGAC